MKGVCFNCWSAGKGKRCMMHKDDAAQGHQKKAESALMCKNWDLGVLRRRYRSEEIQEVFMKSASSLRYDKDRKQFLTAIEQKHPIYRMTTSKIGKYNFTLRRKAHTSNWLRSFVELLRVGKVAGSETVQKSARMLRLRNSLSNSLAVRKYSNGCYTEHPDPPVTGTTLSERRNQVKLIYDEERTFVSKDPDGKETKTTLTFRFIKVDGVPVPLSLYLPREYELFAPKNIPMPEPSYSKLAEVPPPNLYIAENHPAAWIERFLSRISRDICAQADLMVKTMSPIPGADQLKRTKYPPPLTIKFASFSRKPTKNNLAVGGLPAELLISELVTTYVPPQYGHFTVMDRASVAPDISPEITASFLTIVLPHQNQKYVARMLVHPLNSRRPPTITLSTALKDFTNKYYYGHNRPSQTGEDAHHGFRTSIACMEPIFDPKTSPGTFLPSDDVATLNLPAANRTVTTHADRNYPFCEPTNRDNTTLDFYHLLLLGICSPNKEQIFTNLGVQEPGDFMRGCDPSRPLGHCVAVIYRSWAFLQKSPIEEFLTDDGIPYWYDRRTGETFWERPLHKEEKVPVKEGGSVLGGQGEMPSVGQGASAEYKPRYDQLDMRKAIVRKHETEEMTVERRKSTAQSAVWARDQGILPDLPKIEVPAPSGGPSGHDAHGHAHHNGGGAEAAEGPRTGSASGKRASIGPGPPGAHNNLPQSAGGQSAPSSSQDPRSLSPSRRRGSSVELNPAGVNVGGFSDQTAQVVNAITQQLAGALQGAVNPQDILKLGMGLGISLQQAGIIGVGGSVDALSSSSEGAGASKSSPGKKGSPQKEQTGNSGWDINVRTPMGPGQHPIGMANATNIVGMQNSLDHTSEQQQKAHLIAEATAVRTVDAFKGLQLVEPTAAPDEVMGKPKVLQDSEEMMRLTVPVLAYPERVFLKSDFLTHPAGGLGTSYVAQGEGESQKTIKGEGVVLRRSNEPVPEGFLNAIGATHVGKQNVDYLPNVPNLPQCKPVGRVKPRSAAEDWLAIGFDPWSAGKEPLSAEFIPNMTVKDDSLLTAKDKGSADGAFINLMDKKGLEAQQEISALENKMASDFAELCSFVRHGKYKEVEDKLNEPDWTLPVDYPDAVGNTLLMVCCQNGNKRLSKLCLRRGAELNKQNINGQSCLHYCFGYGFEDLGEYLVQKGADDSMKNADGLTCYEGLNLGDVEGI